MNSGTQLKPANWYPTKPEIFFEFQNLSKITKTFHEFIYYEKYAYFL